MSRLFSTCLSCKIKISPKTGHCWKCGKPRAWDGKVHLLLGGTTRTPYFPTGCLGIVVDVLTRNDCNVLFKDLRSPALVLPPEAYKVSLRDPQNPEKQRILWEHQEDAIQAAIKYERGVIQAPTGSGKTSILAGLAKLYDLPTVVLIHNTSIAKQLQDEIAAMTGEKVGLIKGGQWKTERITVAMVQSLIDKAGLSSRTKKEKIKPTSEAIELIKNTGLLLLDEIHHAAAHTWFTLVKQFTNTRYRFGVSGTPFMRSAGDDLLMVGATGNLIYEIPEQELIAAGLIARPIIHFYKVDEPYLEDDLDYQEVYRQGIVENHYFNKLAANVISDWYNKKAQILVLLEHIKHIENLAALLQPLEFKILTGDSSVEERIEVVKSFVAGKLRLIVSSKVFDEGVDITNVDVVVRMGGTKTKIKSKQQLGRGQRAKTNKPNELNVVDFLHTTHRFLKEHSYAHYETYRDLGYEIKIEN